MITNDPNDPLLKETDATGQQKAYLALPDEERKKGFVRTVRRSYIHVGIPGPKYPLRDLTAEEKEMFAGQNYVKYEEYPEEMRPAMGMFWTQRTLDGGCRSKTTMAQALAETYARDPKFYGATFCCVCGRHFPVSEFVWDGTDERVGS